MDPFIGAGSNAATIFDSILVHIRDLRQRYKDNKNNEEKIKTLVKEVERCQQLYTNLDGICNRAEASLSKELKDSYQVLKCDLVDKLEGIDRAVSSFSDRVQSESSSSKMGKIIKKATRFWNASRDATKMEKHSKALSQFLDKCVHRTEILNREIGDEYCATFDGPELGDVVLDFNDDDAPECKLKVQVLKGGRITSAVGKPSQSGSASGASGEATSVEGMGGIGKTIALIGLANDPDVRNEFKDGVYFMTFGRDADEFKAIHQVSKIVRQSGGNIMSKGMLSLSTLEEAVSKAVKWFKDRTVLYVCDDLWPTENNAYGFLPHLEQLTKSSKTCHLVVATRSHKLARGAHVKVNVVTFNCLDVAGKRAREIFLNDAGISDVVYKALPVRIRDTIGEILTKCGGHCLAMAVAGRGIRETINEGKNVEKTIEEYSNRLKKYVCHLVDEDGPKIYTKSVFNCFEISLSLVDKWASAKRLSRNFSDQFSRLCIFGKQSQITASTLTYAWDIRENSVIFQKLTDLKLLNVEGNMYSFHDLIHDFCTRNAEGKVRFYHREILNRIVRAGSERNYKQPGTSEVNAGGRDWWNVQVGNDVEDYLFSNLARHLRHGEMREELTMLLTRFEWTVFRFRRREQHHLMHDFANWFSMMQDTEDVNEMKRIRQAIHLSWDRSVKSNTVSDLASQMQGSLLNLPGNLQLVNRYIESLNKAKDLEVWLKPLSRIWPLITTGQSIIDVGGAVEDLAFNWETNEGVAVSAGKVRWVDFKTMTFNTMMKATEESNCVTWSKNGKIIACNDGNNIMMFDGQTKERKSRICATESFVRSLTLSDDGSTICCGDSNGVVRLWKVESREEVSMLRGHRDWVMSVAFSPDGGRIVSGSYDRTVRIWDTKSSNSIFVLSGHEAGVTSAAFSHDGKRIVSASPDEKVRIWDAESGNEIFVLHGHQNCIVTVAFSPDGGRIVSASVDKTIRIWDAKSGDQIFVLRGHQSSVNSVAFSPDGGRIVSASRDQMVRIWDAQSWDKASVPHGHQNSVNSVAFSLDGRRIVSAADDMTVRLWDAKSEDPIFVLHGHQDRVMSVAFSPDGGRVVSASHDRTIRIWNAKFAAKSLVLRGHEDWVKSVAFSPDGERIVSASHDKTVRIWDAKSGKEISVLNGHEDGVSSVAFSPDGGQIVSASYDETVRIWNVCSVLRSNANEVSSVALSPVEQRLDLASIGETDARSEEETFVLHGHQDEVNSAAFSPDGRRIVSASHDKTVRVWDVKSREVIFVLHGHQGGVRSVAFSPDGGQIISASSDMTVRVWDVAVVNNPLEHNDETKKQQLCQITLPSKCLASAITNYAHGDFVVAGLMNGQIVRFELVQ